jgi:hypothetical protein
MRLVPLLLPQRTDPILSDEAADQTTKETYFTSLPNVSLGKVSQILFQIDPK